MTNEAEKTPEQKRAAEAWFERAVAQIESESIREWARGQKDVWVNALRPEAIKSADPDSMLAAYIVIMAMG